MVKLKIGNLNYECDHFVDEYLINNFEKVKKYYTFFLKPDQIKDNDNIEAELKNTNNTIIIFIDNSISTITTEVQFKKLIFYYFDKINNTLTFKEDIGG